MQEFILRYNVVSDDTFIVADQGKHLGGGIIAIVTHHVRATPWTDHATVKKFKSIKRALDYISKNNLDGEGMIDLNGYEI